MQNNFIIIPGLTAELSGNYELPIDYGTLSIGNRYYVDMGLSKSLLNKKASLKLALSDVFNTNEQNITSAYPGLTYDLYQKNDTQIGKSVSLIALVKMKLNQHVVVLQEQKMSKVE